jgi:hypothetical protein
MGAETSVHAISPKNVVAPRPAGAKRLRGIYLQRIEHRRKCGRHHHCVFRNFAGAQTTRRDLGVAGGAPDEDDQTDGIKPERLKNMRGK